jgi:hypothetical protein
MISYLIRVRVRGYIIFLKTYVGYNGYWISGTIDTSTSIKYDTGIGTWAKMEYPCNLRKDLTRTRILSNQCSCDKINIHLMFNFVGLRLICLDINFLPCQKFNLF